MRLGYVLPSLPFSYLTDYVSGHAVYFRHVLVRIGSVANVSHLFVVKFRQRVLRSSAWVSVLALVDQGVLGRTQHHKVLWPVVGFDPVDVVNNLTLNEWATEFLFSDDDAASDVIRGRPRMIGHVEHAVGAGFVRLEDHAALRDGRAVHLHVVASHVGGPSLTGVPAHFASTPAPTGWACGQVGVIGYAGHV